MGAPLFALASIDATLRWARRIDARVSRAGTLAEWWYAARVPYLGTTQEPARRDYRPRADEILLQACLRHRYS